MDVVDETAGLVRSGQHAGVTRIGVTGHSRVCDLAVLRAIEESLQSCFVVATSTSPASGSDPQSAEGREHGASRPVHSARSMLKHRRPDQAGTVPEARDRYRVNRIVGTVLAGA